MEKYTNAPRNLLEGWVVLAVDDHHDSRQVMADILSYYGATVILAENGCEGYEKAKTYLPRFIISDISMPEMDGWEMIEALKNDMRTVAIPVIALTAFAMREDRTRALSMGFHNYLAKPLSASNFLSQVLFMLDDIKPIHQELAARLLA